MNGPLTLESTVRAAAFAVVFAILGLTVASGQRATARFAATVNLVEVWATVTDDAGNPVGGLGIDDFEVYENGRRQVIEAFVDGALPVTLAIGIDRSWSMAGEPLALAKQATIDAIRALEPADRTMVVAIDSLATVVAPLEMPRFDQVTVVGALDPWSTSGLRDAVVVTLDRLATEPGRQALGLVVRRCRSV